MIMQNEVKNMKLRKLLANISRDYLRKRGIYQYRMKKVADMTDDEVISACHRYCEDYQLVTEWQEVRGKAESEYRYCFYLEEYVEEGLCYDLQMITLGYIKPTDLHEIKMDKEKCMKCCSECKYGL